MHKSNKLEELKKERDDQKNRCKKIDQFKAAFAQYEAGELNKDQFKSLMMIDYGVKDTGCLQKILSSTQLDKNSFKEILKNTDLIKHKEPEEKKNVYYNPKYNLYKRVLANPQSHSSPYETNPHLKKGTTEYITNKISAEEYCSLLKNEGINPNIERIKKLIRSKEDVNQISYNELMMKINTHKNDSNASDKMPMAKGIDYRFKESEEDTKEKLLVNNKNRYIVYGAKKKIESDANAFKSEKEIFDWDLNMLKTDEKNKANNPSMNYAKTLNKKNLASNIFHSTNQSKEGNVTDNYYTYTPIPTNHTKACITKHYRGKSDIFNLKPDDSQCNNINTKTNRNNDRVYYSKDLSALKRINKNIESSTRDKSTQPSMRGKSKNIFNQTSKENCLFKDMATSS